MVIAKSRLTRQCQISVPAEVRRRLGIGPGATIEWEEEGGNLVVRRTGKVTFEDVHRAVFPEGPPKRRSLKEMDEGIAQYMREKHARR